MQLLPQHPVRLRGIIHMLSAHISCIHLVNLFFQVCIECVLQPAEQVHLQVLPIPLHSVHCACGSGYLVLCSHVLTGGKEGIL